MKIGIIGRIAEGKNLSDGQTVKTRVLKYELEQFFPEAEIMCVETYKIMWRMGAAFLQTIRLLDQCDCIFVLLSGRGRSFFFPLLYWLDKWYKKPIYHDAIGGRLAQEVIKKKNWKKYLNAFKVNWVEIPSLKDRLNELGIDNARVLPNFKRLPVLKQEELNTKIPEIYKFCTFSRVTETKGIETAANAIQYVNKTAGKQIAQLHVYGPVEPAYKKKFDDMLNEREGEVVYMGVVPYDKSVNAIKTYYMLLFPSVHHGEGFPGTFIDAYAAGVPIIASDWNYNKELIKEGETGFCYPFDDKEQFYSLVWDCVQKPEMVLQMKKKCIEKAMEYTPETVIKTICEQMKKDKVITY